MLLFFLLKMLLLTGCFSASQSAERVRLIKLRVLLINIVPIYSVLSPSLLIATFQLSRVGVEIFLPTRFWTALRYTAFRDFTEKHGGEFPDLNLPLIFESSIN